MMGTLFIGTLYQDGSPDATGGPCIIGREDAYISVIPEYYVFTRSSELPNDEYGPADGVVYDREQLFKVSDLPSIRPESFWIPPCQIDTKDTSSNLEKYKIYTVMVTVDRDKEGGGLGVNNALTSIHTCRMFRYLASPRTKFEDLRRLIAKSCGVSTSVIQTMPALRQSHKEPVPEAPPARYYNNNFLTVTSVDPGKAFTLTGQELVNKKLPSAQTSNSQYAKDLWNSLTLEGGGVSEAGLICCQTFPYAY